MKRFFFGAVLLILAPAPAMGQVSADTSAQITLTDLFLTAVGLQESIAEMTGDTTREYFTWTVSSSTPPLFFEKGGNVLVPGIAWYRVTLPEDGVTIMWSSDLGRMWLPAGNATFFSHKKNPGWRLAIQDEMEVSSQHLQNLIKKIKAE